MSDIRFILAGVALIFVGFIVLGVLGQEYQAATFEANEFGTCYDYSDDKAPVEINCSYKIFDQAVFFGIVIAFIGAGILALVKGATGNWDSKVKPEDMVGPGRRDGDESKNQDE